MDTENDMINLIIANSRFNEYCGKNAGTEKGRRFCRHDLGHFLDVARIAYIYNLEKGLGFRKDIIYGAALLHDIGKWRQNEDGSPHQLVSAELSKEILDACGYDKAEKELIISAILTHRDKVPEHDSLNYLIFFGDKKSRNCFACGASDECGWGYAKKE